VSDAGGWSGEQILFGSAADAERSLRSGEVSSRELTEMLLAQIEKVNPAVNAVVEVRPEAALRAAAAADQAMARGSTVGPWHGLPMTIKDCFSVAGLHTTWGNPAFKDYVADWDATVVQRLQQAGAIIVGKTNVAFMLADYGQTANDVYGVTSNPWDPGRTPGGSSGGSAAAVSAGLTFLEFGSDLVGSIRIPASFCGVYGLKPSSRSGCRTPPCRACPPSPRPSAARPADSPWAPKSWVPSTRTTPRSPSPNCSPTTWAATNHRPVTS
jgi:amidase